MYIYHNTDIEYFIDILYDGTLRAGEDTKISNMNIHKHLQKYIYFNIMKKKGFKYMLPYTFIFPASVLYDYKFYINTQAQSGWLNKCVITYEKNTEFIDVILMMLFEFIIKILNKKKKEFGEYHPYYISQLYHELFIEKPLSLSKAKYILLPKNIDWRLERVIKHKVTQLYPNIKILYVSKYI